MIVLTIAAIVVVLFGSVAFIGAPYVPSLRREVRAAFDTLYPLGPSDVVVDLGSGDGLVLQEIHRRGARAIGIEINPLLVFASRLRLRGGATITLGDMWRSKLPADATLLYAFSVTRDAKKLAQRVQQHANSTGRPIKLMTFGATQKNFTPIAEFRAHTLYEIHPR